MALSLHGAADPETGRRVSGELPIADRDRRIERGLQLLGDPAAVDLPVHAAPAPPTVPAHLYACSSSGPPLAQQKPTSAFPLPRALPQTP